MNEAILLILGACCISFEVEPVVVTALRAMAAAVLKGADAELPAAVVVVVAEEEEAEDEFDKDVVISPFDEIIKGLLVAINCWLLVQLPL